MSEKQKETLVKFGEVITKMSDKELEDLLLIGEGMAIMSDIKKDKNSLDKVNQNNMRR